MSAPADPDPDERAHRGAGHGTSTISDRKRAHLDAVLGGAVGFGSVSTGLDDIRVASTALPESALRDVDLGVDVMGRHLAAPLLVSCMTGGTSEAGPVNRALAAAAQATGVALGLGSGRALLADPSLAASFEVRDVAPDVLLLANLGAVQLAEHGVDDCARLVDQLGADVLVLHLNAVQEAVQQGGDTDFAGVLERIGRLSASLRVPVIVKEVGFGLADADVAALVDVGVAGIDVAGAGGTNWARVEGALDADAAMLAEAFIDWGRPTAACVAGARAVIDARGADVVLIGSGGLRHGVDALKVLGLGADLAGMARGLLAAAAEGSQQATAAVGAWRRQLEIAAWAAGVTSRDQIGPHLLVGAQP